MREEENHDSNWWWIDYLENEMDPNLDKDLQLLLEHSQEDRDSFESFRQLREWLAASDPIADWPLTQRAKRVRAAVMEMIEREEKAYSAGKELTKFLSV